MFVETNRLIVRDFLEEDVYGAYQYLSDERVMKFVEPIFSLEQTKEFVLTYGCEKNMVFALMEKESKKLIGHMIFHPYDSQDEYEIGWILNSDYWGKGYAAEASEALIGYAFENLNANRIVAETVDRNVHALSIIQKLGMKENEMRSGTFLKLFEINK